MKRVLARVLTIGAATGALALGVVGFAHTSAGRPLLSAVMRVAHGGCPFGYDQTLSPAQRERAQLSFAITHRGERRARSRPALGFLLDRTTHSEVVAQLAAHGIACAPGKGMSDLTCLEVPSQALPNAEGPARNLWFTFGVRQQLLSVIALSRAHDADTISEAFVATRSTLDDQAGTVTKTGGDSDPLVLTQGALHQASAEFRFHDYYALARATNLGQSFVLTEEYRSLPD
ncbi:MAG: hypothetical protein ABJB12_17915 [Pseudomonadota bacterium]